VKGNASGTTKLVGVALALFVELEELRAGKASGAAATHEGSQPVHGDPPARSTKDVLRPE